MPDQIDTMPDMWGGLHHGDFGLVDFGAGGGGGVEGPVALSDAVLFCDVRWLLFFWGRGKGVGRRTNQTVQLVEDGPC